MRGLLVKFLFIKVISNYNIVPMGKYDLFHDHQPNEVISQLYAEKQEPLFGLNFYLNYEKYFRIPFTYI